MKRLLFLTLSAGWVLAQIACNTSQQKTEPISSTPAAANNAPASTGARPSGPPTETVEGDIRIVNYTNTGGRQPKLGEVAIAYVSNWVGDTAIASSRVQFGGTMPVPVQPVKNMADAPLMWAIMHMGVGDSIVVYRPIDPAIMSVLPPRLKKEKLMRAEVVLTDVKDAKDVKIPEIPKVIHQ